MRRALPVAQYPEILPPQIVVSATYPGASAQTIAETMAAPLEQQINGVENSIYMQSTSTASGTLNLSVFFQTGTNADQANINVNNRTEVLGSENVLTDQEQILPYMKIMMPVDEAQHAPSAALIATEVEQVQRLLVELELVCAEVGN